MKKKRFIALTMAMTLASMGLTGCSNETEIKQAIEDKTKTVEVVTSSNLLDYYVEKPKVREFEEGEHVLFKRYYVPNIDNDNKIYSNEIIDANQGSIDVPEGYRVLSVNTICDNYYKYSYSTAVDIWFENNQKVIVEPVLNEKTGLYDYSDFGMIMIDLIDYGESYTK